MISIRGKVWFILLALIRKRIGSLLKVTKSKRIGAASQRWKKNNKFLISEKFLKCFCSDNLFSYFHILNGFFIFFYYL